MTEILIFVLSLLTFISLSTAIAIGAAYLKLKAQFKARPESRELQECLMDLMAGQAIVKVSRIDPTDVLIRARSRGELG